MDGVLVSICKKIKSGYVGKNSKKTKVYVAIFQDISPRAPVNSVSEWFDTNLKM